MYVLDTNVISELRKGKKAERGVRMWAQGAPHGQPLFVRGLGAGIRNRNPSRRTP
jgi:predicted nucleic acid-binding protein